MKAKRSISSRIREYLATHPEAKPRDVAAAIKCNVTNVYAITKKRRDVVAKEPNIVRAPAPVAPTPSPIQSIMPGDTTLGFIMASLTNAELIGYFKGCMITHSVGGTAIDAACAAWYAEKLRGALSPR
jgi:hypothetical protein